MTELRDQRTDEELYLASIGGDRDAVHALVDRYHDQLLIWVRAKTNVKSMADDAVAEAWLRFFRHVGDATDDPVRALRQPGSIRFWLNRTASNALNDLFRQQSRQAALAERFGAEVGVQGGSVYTQDELASIEAEERRAAVRQGFDRLSAGCRELLALMAVDPPLPYREIAELLERPVGSLGPTRQRCLGELRELIGGDVE